MADKEAALPAEVLSRELAAGARIDRALAAVELAGVR
jgi:hypothetical protein